MPAPSDWAGVGTALCWGDGSALHGGLTPLSFPLQGSRGAKGAKVSLCFCTIFLWEALGIWESLHGPCSLFQGEKGRRGIDGIDGMKVNLCSRALCLA